MRAITIIFAVLLTAATVSAGKKIVCYFGSWAANRPNNGKFTASDINPTLCTHLIYAFVGLNADGSVQVLDPSIDLPEGKNGFGEFNALRKRSPKTKTMIAMGGWNEGSKNYSIVASDSNLRSQFADNVVAFVKKYDFNGFDLDWEYPAQREGSTAADKENFVLMLKELRQRFDKEGLILSAAVASAESSASLSYDIPAISEQLHIINLMTYDLHGSWDNQTGINAPTFSKDKLNVDTIVNYWLKQGAPAEKIVVGVPFYGRGFTLKDHNKHGIGAPVVGPSAAGPYTQEAGTLGYNEICEKFRDLSFEVVYDKEQEVPYAFKGDLWVGFDNECSLTKKCNLVKKRKLGGIMIWSVETDDFRGNCGPKNPLLNTINKVLLR